MSLDELLADPRLFRPRRADGPVGPVVATGFESLDALLPGGGWPRGVLIELLVPAGGIGELRLLMPALTRLGAAGRWLLWVSPPHVPYAPALAGTGIHPGDCVIVHPRNREERVWAIEEALRSGACGAVLGWRCEVATHHARRLQLSAEQGEALAMLFRSPAAARQRSPAALRVRLAAVPAGLAVEVIKARGARPGRVVISRDELEGRRAAQDASQARE